MVGHERSEARVRSALASGLDQGRERPLHERVGSNRHLVADEPRVGHVPVALEPGPEELGPGRTQAGEEAGPPERGVAGGGHAVEPAGLGCQQRTSVAPRSPHRPVPPHVDSQTAEVQAAPRLEQAGPPVRAAGLVPLDPGPGTDLHGQVATEHGRSRRFAPDRGAVREVTPAPVAYQVVDPRVDLVGARSARHHPPGAVEKEGVRADFCAHALSQPPLPHDGEEPLGRGSLLAAHAREIVARLRREPQRLGMRPRAEPRDAVVDQTEADQLLDRPLLPASRPELAPGLPRHAARWAKEVAAGDRQCESGFGRHRRGSREAEAGGEARERRAPGPTLRERAARRRITGPRASAASGPVTALRPESPPSRSLPSAAR